MSQYSFTKEFEVLAQLDHPNLVTLIGFHESDQEFILLMDYYDASPESVLQMKCDLEEGSMNWFTEQEMVQWCIQILDGLAYLHSKHITHRDLKESNFFFI